MRTLSSHVLAVALPAALLMGCGGYHSEYEPPADGRPRLVWQDDQPVVVSANNHDCNNEVRELLHDDDDGRKRRVYRDRRGSSGGTTSVSVSTGGYWVPRHVVVPRLHHVPHIPLPHNIIGGALASGGGGGDLDLGKAGEGIIYLLIAAVVVADVALSFMALGFALSSPENEAASAANIDWFNAQTDLARVEGSACDEFALAAEGNEGDK